VARKGLWKNREKKTGGKKESRGFSRRKADNRRDEIKAVTNKKYRVRGREGEEEGHLKKSWQKVALSGKIQDYPVHRKVKTKRVVQGRTKKKI